MTVNNLLASLNVEKKNHIIDLTKLQKKKKKKNEIFINSEYVEAIIVFTGKHVTLLNETM